MLTTRCQSQCSAACRQMDADFCVAVLEAALARFGRLEMFDTDQGSQFSLQALTSVLRDAASERSIPDRA